MSSRQVHMSVSAGVAAKCCAFLCLVRVFPLFCQLLCAWQGLIIASFVRLLALSGLHRRTNWQSQWVFNQNLPEVQIITERNSEGSCVDVLSMRIGILPARIKRSLCQHITGNVFSISLRVYVVSRKQTGFRMVYA